MTPQYKKGPMGYMLDLREAMGRTHQLTGEWCKAFDAGDDEAMLHLSEMCGEAAKDFNAAAEGLTKAQSE